MLEIFKSTLDQYLTDDDDNIILCAVSGGIDSMVMVSIFKSLGRPIAVAYVDHNTRKGLSTSDGNFVKEFCKKNNLTFHTTKIIEGALPGKNFQSEARDFRYRYFNSLTEKYNYQYIATAHHKDDRVETFFMNLAKSAGLQGLSSLTYKNGSIIRPLLPFTKDQIKSYAEKNGVDHVHDQSNDEDNYIRNKVRHHIIPASEQVFPDFTNSASKSISYLESEKKLLDELILSTGIAKQKEEHIEINVEQIRSFKSAQQLAYRLLSSYGYSASDVQDILRTGDSGQCFDTELYQGIMHQNNFLVRKRISITNDWSFELEQGENLETRDGLQITFCIDGIPKGILSFPVDNNRPVVIRNTRDGDSIKPWHMGGKSKKLKKLFSDLKLSLWEREKVIVFEQRGAIVAIFSRGNLLTTEKIDGYMIKSFITIK